MKTKKMLILLLFISIISCVHKKESPPQGKILKSIIRKEYSTHNSGLHTNSLYDILVDRKGNKWMTTWEKGLIKFAANGEWKVFNKSNSGLPDNNIRSIAVDNDNNIWLGTRYSGLVKFDGTNWTIYNTTNSPLRSDCIRTVDVDKNNVIWFSNIWFSDSITKKGGLMSYDGADWNLYTPENSILVTSVIFKIFVDPGNNVWLGPEWGGAIKISEGEWTYYENIISGEFLPTWPLEDFCSDTEGNIWASSEALFSSDYLDGTLVRYDGKEWKEFLPSETGRMENSVYRITCDHFSNVWISFRGISTNFAMFNGSKWFIIEDIDPGFQEISGFNDLIFDENNILWGTISGEEEGFGLIEIRPVYE